MSKNHDPNPERKLPNRSHAAVFLAKSSLLKLRRFYVDAFRTPVKTFDRAAIVTIDEPVIAESRTRLWTETEPEERLLVAGKIQNLRIAIAALNGIRVPAGETFSFWRHVGRATKARGFVRGREIREGCIIPTVGGGLCQLSNSLYDAALKANFTIVERHPHTQVVPGSLAEIGRDATVYWNYVDLRFRSSEAFTIEAKMDGEHLTIRFRGQRPEERTLHQIERAARHNGDEPNSCATCGMADCFRALKPTEVVDRKRSAYMVDEFSPEFDEVIHQRRGGDDILFMPIDGRRFRKANYAWTTDGFGTVAQSFGTTAIRSYRSRKLATQGAARQQNLLAMYERLAESYARRLAFDVLHLVIHQNLLPYLWRGGHLGGRTFDVLMNALPMNEIQRRLDHAFSLHPESTTLDDFRADNDLIAAEADALEHAATVITSHSEIAALFGDRAELLEWSIPARKGRERTKNAKPCIVFPASTVGRKGCYELRDAVRGMDVHLITLGPSIESADFWKGFDVSHNDGDWLDKADLVVLPAFVEHRPRRLLMAAAAGVPVIASPACGVRHVPGITTLDTVDTALLANAITSALN